MILTTENHSALDVKVRLGLIQGQCVVGLNVFRDITALVKDMTGQRLGTAEAKYAEAQQVVTDQLRQNAAALGADAVVAVQFTYGELTGGQKAMLTCVGIGTAVKLAAA